MIRVEGFHKAYRETVAVADVSFAVGAGEVLGLVGPNGAGKTTTLRALCGILPPTRGWLWVEVPEPRLVVLFTKYLRSPPSGS